ncbi:hypothetical protein BC938DRAFT_471695 [Jimgerdemannia flammicorona]|uniref:Galactose oxidase n=1 Tax=Jimgerdemannia flammicorona TaxID=994334 RepID=A0A433Q7L4_9FUNG|nr:hypothetical protein BC938DRAFT_471695 [Jimgerdemannia flammicorona]
MQVGPDGTSLWVYGGQPTNATSANIFLCYDTTAHTWSTVAVAGAIRLQGFSAVRNSKGIFFFFGGVTDETSLDEWARNDAVLKIDLAMKTWSTTSVANGYPGRVMHTATLVNDTKVYIIGGALQTATTGVIAPIDNITVYDTVAGTWSSSMSTGSQLPQNRSGHSAVLSDTDQDCGYCNLGYDGNSIVIFGGGGINTVYFNDVWTLDVNSFQWTSPTITGSGPKTGIYGMNCSGHANSTAASTYYNDVYVLDTKNWAWATSFTAEAPSLTITVTPTPIETPSATNDIGGIGVIGGIGGLVGIICGFLSLIGVIALIVWTVRGRQTDAGVKPNENPELSMLFKPNENTTPAELPTVPKEDPSPPNTPSTTSARDSVVIPHTITSTEYPSDSHLPLPQSSPMQSDASISQTGPAVIGGYPALYQPYYYPQPNVNPALHPSMYYYHGTPPFQPGYYYPPPLPQPHGTFFHDNPHMGGRHRAPTKVLCQPRVSPSTVSGGITCCFGQTSPQDGGDR